MDPMGSLGFHAQSRRQLPALELSVRDARHYAIGYRAGDGESVEVAMERRRL
jgi:hypothetical protein